MRELLTPLFAVAAILICVAGAAKLRSPAGAMRALVIAGLPVRAGVVRLFAAGEVGLAAWCLFDPALVPAATLACCYSLFAALTLLLARRRASCGCFGGGDAPASSMQSALSAVLALIAMAAVVWTPHAIGWMLGRPVMMAVALAAGTVGSTYAAVLAYTELPQAWGSWTPS